MTTYIVGDIQGCYRSLRGVLDQVQFDVARDRLWSVGDIVNRGPQSLETLRFLKQLGSAFQMVLGNHDLHLLAVAYGYKDAKRGDTLDTILNAPDRIDLLEWLRHQPLILDQQTDLVVHAGIPAIWPRDKALALAQEVTRVLRSDLCHEFFRNMYGNEPAI